MAFTPIVLANVSLSFWKGSANQFSFKFADTVPDVVDVSAWYSLTLIIYAAVNGENCQLAHLNLTGLCTFSTPTDTFLVPAASLGSVDDLPSGSYSYVIQGQPSSGDDLQAIASGGLTLSAPNDFTPSP